MSVDTTACFAVLYFLLRVHVRDTRMDEFSFQHVTSRLSINYLFYVGTSNWISNYKCKILEVI